MINSTETTAVLGPVQRQVRPLRKMQQTAEDNAIGDDGYRMQREYGETPNGNLIAGRWVLRGPECQWIDVDQYRHDLLARNGFEAA